MAYDIQQTEAFVKWRRGIRDQKAAIAIARRLERAQNGNLGDVKPVGSEISEMRIDAGAGYRLYFTLRGQTLIVLLCGGSKAGQQQDIKRAKSLAQEY